MATPVFCPARRSSPRGLRRSCGSAASPRRGSPTRRRVERLRHPRAGRGKSSSASAHARRRRRPRPFSAGRLRRNAAIAIQCDNSTCAASEAASGDHEQNHRKAVRGGRGVLRRPATSPGIRGCDAGTVAVRARSVILFHSERTASADRVRRMAAPRRHLALVCFLHQAWRDTLDQAVEMYGKLLDLNRKLVEARLDDMLKAQRRPSTGSFTATASSARCCSIPTSATTSCGSGCCQPCPRRSCARASPTWRTGRGATGRPASSR